MTQVEQLVVQEVGRAIDEIQQAAYIVDEAARRVKGTIGEARDNLCNELRESVRVITEMKQNLEQVTEGAEHETRTELEEVAEPTEYTPAATYEKEEVAEPTEYTPAAAHGKEEVVEPTEYTPAAAHGKEDVAEPTEYTPAAAHEREEVVEPTAAKGHDSASQEAGDDKLFVGTLELHITSPRDSKQFDSLLRYLSQVPGLEVLLRGGSTNKKASVTVFIPKPLPLLTILKQMSLAKDVVEKKKNIEVVLDTSVGDGWWTG